MNKMKLDLDSLFVESFDTSSGPAGRGTVRGHDTWEPAQSQAKTCLCPASSVCIVTDDDPSCGFSLCPVATCTCPPPTVNQFTCETACVDTCFRCPALTIEEFC